MTATSNPTPHSLRLVRGGVSEFGELSNANAKIVQSIVEGDVPVVVRGAPGSGRTSVALAVAKGLREKLGGNVYVITPDRLRADLLQRAGELALPGIVRPVRTQISLAYTFTSTWYVERLEPLPAPQLLTGAQEDLALAEAIEAGLVEWPESLRNSLQMPEFRMQIRNLMARVHEAGWDGVKLEALGRQFDRGVWTATGKLMQIWQEQRRLEGPEATLRLDSSSLQEHAAALVRNWDANRESEGVVADLPLPSAVVVDDLQDCTRATLSLLEALHQAGTRVIVTADSDVAVSVYRGGEPHLDVRFARRLGAQAIYLGPTHRGNQAMRAIVQRVTEQTSVQHSAHHRLAGSVDPNTDASGLSVTTYGSAAQEANAIARTIVRYQLGRGPGVNHPVPLKDQAIIVRTSSDVRRLRFALLRNGIEATVRRRATVYAANVTTATLLRLLARDPLQSEAVLFDDLLRGPFINARTEHLRKVTDIFRARIDEANTSIFAMVEQLMSGRPETEKVREHLKLVGLEQILGDLERAWSLMKLGEKVRVHSPQEALWALWEAADVQEKWVKKALKPGVDSVVFDERLDAVVSLFRSADVWQQRNEDSSAEHFAHELLEERVPTDTLAPSGQRPKGVQILTASDAIGQEWDVVYIASVQDGKWPNLTLRDRLSQAGDIADLRNTPEVEWASLSSWNSNRSRRKASLTEEYRYLGAAVSRALRALHISAIQNEEEAPSQFLYKLAKWIGVERIDGFHLPVTPVNPGIDTRSLVARLRQKLAQSESGPEHEYLSTLLALLTVAGAQSANPANWNGIGGITQESGVAGVVPRLSPSQIETLVQCPARWFFTQHGASGFENVASSTGSLIHKLAEQWPEAECDELLEHLDELWDDETLDRETTLGQAEYQKVVNKLEKLANYLAGWRGKEVDVERPISSKVEIDGKELLISGRIDRLEHVDKGVIVTDIKTGKGVSKKDTEMHLQLAAYQFALAALGEDVKEARILSLEKSRDTVTVQPGLFQEEPKSEEDLQVVLASFIKSAAESASGQSFEAFPDTYCAYCPAKNTCPVFGEGERTLQ